MILFACDLDNTLIYSQKRALPVPKFCVELYRGEPITYMTDATAKLLRRAAARSLFVPVTTRTIEQYQRISFPVAVPYALVCNGGVLLRQESEAPEWYEDTRRLVMPSEEELQKAERFLKADKYRNFELRKIRELFLFTKSDNPAATVAYLTEKLDGGAVDVFSNGVKIYVLPKQLTKGNALMRFKKYLRDMGEEAELIAAAGDSAFDISMLEAADIGYVPEALAEIHDFPASVSSLREGNSAFSEKMLRRALKSFTNINGKSP